MLACLIEGGLPPLSFRTFPPLAGETLWFEASPRFGFRAVDNSHALPRLAGVFLFQHRRRRQTVGPPGSVWKIRPRHHSVHAPRWCCSLPRTTMRVDVCRIRDAFARTLNGQTPPRPSRLDSGFRRNDAGLARSPFVLRTFPPRAGATRRLSRRRASAVWLAVIVGASVTLRIRALKLQRSP